MARRDRKNKTPIGGPAPIIQPRVAQISVRRSKAYPGLELVLQGTGLVGTATGPLVMVNGIPCPYVVHEGPAVTALVPEGPRGRVRVALGYGDTFVDIGAVELRAGAKASTPRGKK